MPKFHISNYTKSTPTFFRKLGDSLLIFGTTMTATFAGMEIHKEWIIAAAVLTAFSKMLTNLFTDEEQTKVKPNEESETNN